MKFNEHGYLDAGLHDATLADIKTHLIDGFPDSRTRNGIFAGYERHTQELKSVGVHFEQFVDGSFVSQKKDPTDIDFVCFADADTIDALPEGEKQKLGRLLSGDGAKVPYCCDAYFQPTVPQNDPRFAITRPRRKYWMGEFGFDRCDRPKGLLRVEVTPAVAPTAPDDVLEPANAPIDPGNVK